MVTSLASNIHHGFIEPLLRTGRIPTAVEVADALGISADDVRQGLRNLAETHGVVLHPHVVEPWVIHPFSASPSATWVESAGRGWWSPCMWCAFGIAALVDGPVTIHSRIGGEAEDVDVHIEDGRVRESDLWVHFAVPPISSWQNVHHFCATVLPFRNGADVDDWSARHGLPKGAVVPVQQCADLGRAWYATHADRDWTKWTVRQAGEIFASVGLLDPFWALPDGDGRY